MGWDFRKFSLKFSQCSNLAAPAFRAPTLGPMETRVRAWLFSTGSVFHLSVYGQIGNIPNLFFPTHVEALSSFLFEKSKQWFFYGFLHIRYVIHFKKPEKLWLLQVFAGSVYLVKGPLQAKWHINLRWDITGVGTCYSSPCFPLCSTKNNFLGDVRHIAGLESDVQCFTAAVLTRRTFLEIL